MKSIRSTQAYAGLVLLSALWSSVGESLSAERKPLVRPNDEELNYRPTGMRTRLDPATHQYVKYAVEGKITRDQGAGTYNLEWTGVDGQKKRLNWVPPNKIAAEVAAAVNYDPKLQSFEYSYDVTSLAASEQKLQSLYITSRSEVASGANPDGTWYSSPFTQYLRQVFRTEGGWTWSQTMGGRFGLNPGETAKRFRLRSVGVPTVVKCYARGYTETLRSSEDVPEELMEAIDRISWKVPYGPTIGPGLPADRMSSQLIAQSLPQFLEISIKQRWITEGDDSTALKRILEKVGHAVSSGNQAEAVKFTDEAIRQLNKAFGNATLLSEARGLLAYNLAALRDKVSKAE
jgi:hypothetical protein